MLAYYGKTVAQCDIAEYTRLNATWYNFGSVNCCANPNQGCNYWNYAWSYAGSIEDILSHWGVGTTPFSSALTLLKSTDEITSNRPFLIRWGWTTGGGHFVIGHGVEGNTMYYMNPWPGEGLKIADYNWVVSDGVHTWTHSQTTTLIPTITLTSTPLNYSNQASGTIGFTANEPATFQCKVDSGSYAPCTSPFSYSGLANGQHTVSIQASDLAGNTSTSTYTWTVNTALAANSAILLPQTGQISCWDTTGTLLTSCVGSGQDGDYNAGLAWPSPRFTLNTAVPDNSGTVTDNLTGLVWSKNANPAATSKTWQGALDYIKSLNSSNYQGHNDWRLPNVNELKSLVNYQQARPDTWLNTQGFSNVQAPYYWSSSSYALSTNYAWNVYMYSGYVSIYNKSYYNYVWRVRGGQLVTLTLSTTGQATCYSESGATIGCSGTGQDGELQKGAAWPSTRFSANADQTVTDNLTGLSWSKDGNPAAATKTWQGALDYIKSLNGSGYLGHSDWRLPNLSELESLVHRGQTNSVTWLNTRGFFNVQASFYWSSSSCASSTDGAWVVGMGSGGVNGGYKYSSYYVWPVRGGQLDTLTLLSLTKAGSGTGSVSASTGTITWFGLSGSAGYAKDTSVTLTATADASSSFTDWSGCDGVSANTCTVAMSAAKSVTATFTLKTYTVTPTVGANGGINPNSSQTVNHGTTKTFTITPNTGYNIVTPVGGTCPAGMLTGNSYTTGAITADCTVAASFAIKTYTVTPSAGANGSISPTTPQTVSHGTTKTFTITPNTGYNIVTPVGGTCPAGALTGNIYTTGAITADCTVAASFAIKTYTITTSAGNNGSLSCNPTTVNYGGSTSCSVTAAIAYRMATFTDNSVDVKSAISGNIYTLTGITASHTLAATFELLPDTTPPTVAITAPVNGTYQPTVYFIKATATDNAAVASLQFTVKFTDNGTDLYLNNTATTFAPTAEVWIPATFEPTGGYWYINTFTTPWAEGKTYTVRARATDGSGNSSTPMTITFTKGNAPQSIPLMVSKSSAAAGSLTSNPAGINSPVGSGPDAFASFLEGSTVTLTATPASGYYFLNWNNCDSATANVCTVTVTADHPVITANFSNQTVTTLTIAPPVTSITSNGAVIVTGALGTIPTTSGSTLYGKTISVTLTRPDGTKLTPYSTTTTDTSGSWSVTIPAIFTTSGTYLATASFAGTTEMIAATSASATILMNKSAGYAIVVTGKRSDNSLLTLHTNTTDAIVATLKQRGFLDSDINYLKSTTSAAVTKAQIQSAVTSWAKEKLATTAAPLYIIMIDHGTPTGFLLGNETLTPANLKGYLDTLEAEPSVATAVASFKRFIIIGACYSGQFITPLSKAGRIVITSAGGDEESLAGVSLWDFNKKEHVIGGEYFLDSLFGNLGRGDDFKEAFNLAKGALHARDVRLINYGNHYGVWDRLAQHPLLEDTGDGVPAYKLDGSDGQMVASLKLGEGVTTNAGDSPADIKQATVPTTLAANVSSTKLLLTANLDARVGAAWVEIRTPDTATTPTSGGQPLITLTTLPLSRNTSTGRWETDWSGFTTSGRYDIFFYTSDIQSSQQSAPVQTTIYKDKAGNTAPGAFDLLTPAESVTVHQSFTPTWTASSDSDGLTYTLEIATDDTFSNIVYREQDIPLATTVVPATSLKDPLNPNLYICQNGTPTANVQDGYCRWRVLATDSFGEITTSTTQRKFTIVPSTTLTVTLSGTGSGSVNSTTQGVTLTCPGACTAPVATGTPVTLAASENNGSSFTGWTACDSVSSKSCTVNMTTAKNPEVTFTLLQNLMIGSATYGTFQTALDGVTTTGQIINARNILLPLESGSTAIYNKSGIRATLKGGFVSGFGSQSGYTSFYGVLKIKGGTLVIDRLVVR